MKYKLLIIIYLTLINLYGQNSLKIGVLAFGTVNWELEVLKHHKLDLKNGFNLEIINID